MKSLFGKLNLIVSLVFTTALFAFTTPAQAEASSISILSHKLYGSIGKIGVYWKYDGPGKPNCRLSSLEGDFTWSDKKTKATDGGKVKFFAKGSGAKHKTVRPGRKNLTTVKWVKSKSKKIEGFKSAKVKFHCTRAPQKYYYATMTP